MPIPTLRGPSRVGIPDTSTVRSATAKSWIRCRFTQKPAPLPKSLPKRTAISAVVERLPGYPEGIGYSGLADGQRWQNVLAQDLPRMHRVNGWVSVDHP